MNEPPWELRFNQEIHLSNDFQISRRRSQRVRIPIPGPEANQLPSYSPRQSTQEQPSPTKAEFQSVLTLVREVIGTDRRPTLELARSYERVRRWRERWSYSPLSSDALESPPPYSPPRDRRPPNLASSPPSPDHSSSPVPDPIPNPPIPGDPVTSAEALFDWVNGFAKANGFGIARHNTHSHKGRKIR
ncbi:hypothetical protein EV126DRAFT_332478, partial [Verticillium dahliae]